MTRIKTVGLALVAVFAISAFAAASASAQLPALETSSNTPAAGTTFTSKSVGTIIPTLEGVSGSKVICEGGETDKGTVTNAQEGTATVIFSGCKAEGILPCNSAGQAEGVIVTQVSTKLVYISVAKKEVGVLIAPAAGTKFECTALAKIEVRGSFVARLPALKLATPFLSIVLVGEQSKGVQKPTVYETSTGKTVRDTLESNKNGGAFEQSAEEVESQQTYSQKVLINA